MTDARESHERNSDEDNSDEDDSYEANIKYVLSDSELVGYQNTDPSVSLLKSMIVNKVPTAEWTDQKLIPFKSLKNMRVSCDLLVCDRNGLSLPIVPFSLLVELIYKVHIKMAHIGKHKLIKAIAMKFYHPSLSKIAADICISCKHCQLFKVSSQTISPPTIKISSKFPFDLFAMDLLQFPKSSAGHVAAFVAVDHYSKFVFAVPIKYKRTSTICKLLSDRIFPSMVRLPARMISDNGKEFTSAQLEALLQQHNIKHVYSSRYRPAGNGAVERVNRTIIEFLKALVRENERSWDCELNRAVIIYNNTWHSQINDTPSNFILKVS